MIRTIAIALVCCCLSCPAMADWQPMHGPYGGNVRVLGASGGNLFANVCAKAYRSTNAGALWMPMPQLDGVNVFFTDMGRIFAGMQHGALRSTDNGDNWTSVNLGLLDSAVTCFTTLDTLMFAGTAQGVYRSADHGDHWAPYNAGLGARWVYSLAATRKDVIVYTADGIFVTRNRGAYWNTTNGGGLNGATLSRMLAIGDTLIGGMMYGGIFLSSDEGNTWTRIDTIADLKWSSVSALLAMHDTLYAGTSGGVYMSPDLGASWPLLSTGLSGVKCLAQSHGALYAGTVANGVMRSSDGGHRWTHVNTGIDQSSISGIIGHNGLIMAAAADSTYRSSNDGMDWETVVDTVSHDSWPRPYLYAISSKVWLSGYYLNRITIDDGLHWSPLDSSLQAFWILGITTDGSQWYAATGGVVYRSSNGGDHWTPMNTYPSSHRWAMDRICYNGGYLIASGGEVLNDYWVHQGIYRCRIGDSVWVPADTSGLFDSDVRVFAHDGVVYAGGGYRSPTMFVSHSNGLTWSRFGNGLQDSVVYAFDSSGAQVFIATAHGVFSTTRDSIGWTNVNDGLPPGVQVNAFTTQNGFLFAATDSNGVWRRPLKELLNDVAERTERSAPRDIRMVTWYPDPVHDDAEISFSVSRPGDVIVRIIDVLGVEALSAFSERAEAGTHRTHVDVRSLRTGFYMIHIHTGDGLLTRPFVVER